MQDSPFRTSDLGLASYLATKGLELLGCVESGEQGRLFFIFKDTPERDQLTEDWVTGRAEVNAKQYEAKRKMCLRLLKDPVG